jgi:ABC-type Na+ transport system ATPase subunit NatA
MMHVFFLPLEQADASLCDLEACARRDAAEASNVGRHYVAIARAVVHESDQTVDTNMHIDGKC